MMTSTAAAPYVFAGRTPRLTIRTRLTLAFAALVAFAGAAMVLIVYIFMRNVPSYPSSLIEQEGAAASVNGTSDSLSSTIPATSSQSMIGLLTIDSPLDILNTTVVVSAIVLTLLIVSGAVAAWLISGRILRPLKAINEAAQVASTGSFKHRVGLTGPRDEVQDLSDTFDDMLGKLDDAFQAHQRFAANASHELRTPIAATHTMLEVALSDPDIQLPELREVSERVFETNRRNGQTVDALLDLAEIGQRPLRSASVSTRELITNALTAYSHEIDERQIVVRTVLSNEDVNGDEALLRQAVMNLVGNAVRHNIDKGALFIVVRAQKDRVQIRVENSGVQLTSAQVDQFVEPFSRGTGRVFVKGSQPQGHGLGLSLVASVIEAHDAELQLTPRLGGGLLATMLLRAAPGAESTSPTATRPVGFGS